MTGEVRLTVILQVKAGSVSVLMVVFVTVMAAPFMAVTTEKESLSAACKAKAISDYR